MIVEQIYIVRPLICSLCYSLNCNLTSRRSLILPCEDVKVSHFVSVNMKRPWFPTETGKDLWASKFCIRQIDKLNDLEWISSRVFPVRISGITRSKISRIYDSLSLLIY